MAAQPQTVEIRSFQVGFGDCFLLSFVYGRKQRRHVLIDFGTTALPRSGKPSEHMPKVAAAIENVVGGKEEAHCGCRDPSACRSHQWVRDRLAHGRIWQSGEIAASAARVAALDRRPECARRRKACNSGEWHKKGVCCIACRP